ncbi:hypothetical protein [Gluconobacter albidus]|nr:hypothetical protein [Gluconobacter albidus]
MAKSITIKTDEELEITLKPAVGGHSKITVRKPNYSELQVAAAKNDGTPDGIAEANMYVYTKATGLTALDIGIMPGNVIRAIDDFLGN